MNDIFDEVANEAEEAQGELENQGVSQMAQQTIIEFIEHYSNASVSYIELNYAEQPAMGDVFDTSYSFKKTYQLPDSVDPK